MPGDPAVSNIVPPDAGEPDGMLAYALARANPKSSDPTWPLPSFDARDWAAAFCKAAAALGHPGLEEGWMLGWFASALMRGFDEAGDRFSHELGAALAGAHEAGRRQGVEAASKAAEQATQRYDGYDGYRKAMDNAAVQQVLVCVAAIRALMPAHGAPKPMESANG